MTIWQQKMQKIYLLVLAFTSGLTIMAVEISAARLIAPYFGTSTFIWTNIIGVIMVALAIGYYFGGKLADKTPEIKILLRLIIFACSILLIVPFIVEPLVRFIGLTLISFQSASIFLFLGSLISVSLLFILPILLLGIVSPFIIKLLSLTNTEIGKDAGLVFSISTVGSIIGTFLPVLFFISYFGTRKTIIIFALVLLIVSLFGLIKRKWFLFLFILILPLLTLDMPGIKPAEGAIFEAESAYQYIQVVDNNGYRYMKMNEGLGVSSILNLKSGQVLTDTYYDYYNLLPYLSGNHDKQDILILGLAGGTISTQLDYFFSPNYDLNIDGVEIDKKVIDIAREYFDLEKESLTIYNQDGRNFLDFTDKKYNSIIIDAYSNQLYISFHLTTKEFFQKISTRIQADGVVAMNVNATSEDSPLLKNITNTMSLVFDHVYLVEIGNNSWNYMILAANNELDFNNLVEINKNTELDHIIQSTLKNYKLVNFDNNHGYLTDDKAPIEHCTDWMILDYIFEN